MRLGNDPLQFYDYTYGEVISLLKAQGERQIERNKEKAIFTYKLADLIGVAVAALFDKKNVFPPIEKVFPGMFEDEPQDVEKTRRKKEMELYKAKFLDFAYRHNNQRKGDNNDS